MIKALLGLCASSVVVLSLTGTGCQEQTIVSGTGAVSVGAKSDPFVIQEIKISPVSASAMAENVRPLTTQSPIVLTFRTNIAAKTSQIEVRLIDLAKGQRVGGREATVPAGKRLEEPMVFRNEADWTVGRHLLEVMVDDKLAEQRFFDVADAKHDTPKN